MKLTIALLTAQLLGIASHAAETPVVLPVWPAGKMPGVGAAAPEMEIPAKGDGVVRLTHVSEPTLTATHSVPTKTPRPGPIVVRHG